MKLKLAIKEDNLIDLAIVDLSYTDFEYLHDNVDAIHVDPDTDQIINSLLAVISQSADAFLPKIVEKVNGIIAKNPVLQSFNLELSNHKEYLNIGVGLKN